MAVSALYPHAQPQQSILSGGNALSMIPTIMQLQQFRSQQAAGQAFQGAVGPDGNFNPNAAMSAIASNPAAALAAPEATTRLLAARGQNIANATSAVGLQSSQNQALGSFLAGFAGKNLTPQDVNTIRAGAVRFGGDPATFGAITTPQQAQQAIKNAQVFSAGAGQGASQVPGGPDQNLAPTAITGAQAVQQGGPGSQRVIGASPIQNADQTAYLADQAKSAQTLAAVRPLEQALPLVKKLDNYSFGPGSKDIANVSSLLQTLGIKGVGGDADENTIRQEVNKKLQSFIQAIPSSDRSDAAQALSQASNPSLDLTKAANTNLIGNAIGMSKQDAAIPLAAGGWQGYQTFKNNWYQNTDPRGFAPMSNADLSSLDKSLPKGSPERKKLVNSIKTGVQLGVVNGPTE
jgi:hypothetical protein